MIQSLCSKVKTTQREEESPQSVNRGRCPSVILKTSARIQWTLSKLVFCLIHSETLLNFTRRKHYLTCGSIHIKVNICTISIVLILCLFSLSFSPSLPLVYGAPCWYPSGGVSGTSRNEQRHKQAFKTRVLCKQHWIKKLNQNQTRSSDSLFISLSIKFIYVSFSFIYHTDDGFLNNDRILLEQIPLLHHQTSDQWLQEV